MKIQNYQLLFAFALIFVNGILKSQDTIFKTDGNTIVSKITEITPTEIKFKKLDNMDGPTYVELKSSVLKVKYSNGSTEFFEKAPATEKAPTAETDDYIDTKKQNNKIESFRGKYTYKDQQYSESKIHKILLDSKDNQIITLVMEAKQAKRMQYVGFFAIPLGIVTMVSGVVGIATYQYDPSFGRSALAIAGVSAIMGIAAPVISASFKTKRTKCNAEAVKIFNEKY